MTNRTIRIWGQGYGSTPVTATTTFNGNTVFSGTIPTVDSFIIYRLPEEQEPIITFEIPVETSGTFPMALTFTGDDVFVAQIDSNYMPSFNPVYSPEQKIIITDPTTPISEKIAIWTQLASPPLTAEEILALENETFEQRQIILAAHNLSFIVSTGPAKFLIVSQPQAKLNVVINGVSESVPNPLPPGVTGEWGWNVPNINGTGTITFDLLVDPGLE